ncbi:MAG: hypothetical protein J6Y29_02060 [Clostridiales bacterium]|nr:hypothetical protein [Clostridiales bacterium]
MFDRDNSQFLFKLFNNDTWNFFVDNNKNLCYSSLNKKKQWSKPTIIKTNIYPSFYADIDNKNSFHLIYQNIKGDIFYTLINSKSIKTIQILKSKTPSTYNKHLRLIPLNDSIHFFYILHYKNSLILSHQILKNATLSNPQILASSSKNLYPYSVFVDSLGNISLYYCFFDGKFYQLGYKIYSPFESMWTKFSQVTNSNSDIQLLDALVDNNNITHILYIEKKFNTIYYSNSNSSIFKCPIVNISDANLLILADTIFIFWIKKDIIHFIKSQDNGLSWSTINEYSMNGELSCVKFKSNAKKNHIFSNVIPATFLNGYTLVSFNELTLDHTNVSAISTNDFKTIVLDSLNLLKNKFESLNSEVSELKSMYKSLNAQYTNLKNNSIKNVPRLNLQQPSILDAETEYQNFLKELKNSYGHINTPNYSPYTKISPHKKRKLYSLKKILGKTFKKVLN